MLQRKSRLQEKKILYTPKYLGPVEQDQDTGYQVSPYLEVIRTRWLCIREFIYWDDPSKSEAIPRSEWLPVQTKD
jgi:hypothetical protein